MKRLYIKFSANEKLLAYQHNRGMFCTSTHSLAGVNPKQQLKKKILHTLSVGVFLCQRLGGLVLHRENAEGPTQQTLQINSFLLVGQCAGRCVSLSVCMQMDLEQNKLHGCFAVIFFFFNTTT